MSAHQLLINRDYTQNPAKIYDFGNCKATATANKRRKLVLTPVAVEKLLLAKFEKNKTRQDAL
jgi:hypothetical protein